MSRPVVVLTLILSLSSGAQIQNDKFAFPPPPPLPSDPGVTTTGGASVCKTGNAEVDQKCVKAAVAAFDYYAVALDHRARSYEWSLISSRAIFVMVMFLVLSGIVFAAIQFKLAIAPRRQLKRGRVDDPLKDTSVHEQLATTFEASASGLKLNSSVLGITILGMSLVFFYAYVKWVYPVIESPIKDGVVSAEKK